MPGKRITDAWLRTLRPPRQDKQRQVTYIDTLERGLALVLVVSYGGSKVFRAGTYIDGINGKTGNKVRKLRTVKLGTYPQMTLKQARDKAREYYTNPQKFVEQAAVGSFKEVADNWIK